MLSIGKLNSKYGVDYYLSCVANSVDDYYLGSGEAPGFWIGKSAKKLGLSAEVTPEQLRLLSSGFDVDGNDLLSPQARQPDRLPGYDLTFSAPKGVSALWAIGDKDLQRQILQAHDRAVESTMEFLSNEACFVRREKGGRVILEADGFISAVFRHRTSRDGDPQLHSHVLVPNICLGPDGRWSAPDGRQIFNWSKTGGSLYQSALRAELAPLGIRFAIRDSGLCEIADIDKAILKTWSKRRAVIEERLAQRGDSSAQAAERAALDTRRAKEKTPQGGPTTDVLKERWAKELTTISVPDGKGGKRKANKDDVLSCIGKDPTPEPDKETIRNVLSIMAGGQFVDPFEVSNDIDEDGSIPRDLTTRASTFSRQDGLRELAKVFSFSPAKIVKLFDELANQPTIIRVAADFLTKGEAIRTKDGRIVRATKGDRRYTTTSMVEVEKRLVDSVDSSLKVGCAKLDLKVIDEVFEQNSLLDKEQREAITQIARSANGVDIVIGEAGTGKTFTFDALRQAYSAQGYKVIGTSLSAKAARELSIKAGISSVTLHRLKKQIDDGWIRLDDTTVIIVDEAAMVGSRALEWLIAKANATQTKVILCGDEKQLPSIDAGGALRFLAKRHKISRLTTNRRQAGKDQAWEREALRKLRSGSIAKALEAYSDNGKLCLFESGQSAREQLLSDWFKVHNGDALIGAPRRVDVAELNLLAHEMRRANGELKGDDLIYKNSKAYAVGDRILVMANKYSANVLNGQFGVIVQLGSSAQNSTETRRSKSQKKRPAKEDPFAITLKMDNGEIVSLDGRFALRHTELGYATTIHKIQGMTCDHTFVWANSALFTEAGYTAMSRGRVSNTMYGLASEDLRFDIGHGKDGLDAKNVLEDITRALSKSHGQIMALEYLADYSKLPDKDGLIESSMRFYCLKDLLGPALESLAKTANQRRSFRQIFEYARERNIIDDTVTTPRLFQLRPYEDMSPEDLKIRRQLLISRDELKVLEKDEAKAKAWLDTNKDKIAEFEYLRRQLSRAERAYGQACIYERPKWALRALGPFPSGESDGLAWEKAAGCLATYRIIFGRDELGKTQPTSPLEADHWLRVRNEIANYHRSIGQESEISESDLQVEPLALAVGQTDIATSAVVRDQIRQGQIKDSAKVMAISPHDWTSILSPTDKALADQVSGAKREELISQLSQTEQLVLRGGDLLKEEGQFSLKELARRAKAPIDKVAPPYIIGMARLNKLAGQKFPKKTGDALYDDLATQAKIMMDEGLSRKVAVQCSVEVGLVICPDLYPNPSAQLIRSLKAGVDRHLDELISPSGTTSFQPPQISGPSL